MSSKAEAEYYGLQCLNAFRKTQGLHAYSTWNECETPSVQRLWCAAAEAVRNAPAYVDPVEDLAKALSDEHDRVLNKKCEPYSSWSEMSESWRDEYRAMARLAISRGAK